MDYRENLTRYVTNFVDELAKSGMTDVVISPGSRSTPLAMTFAEHPNIKVWVLIDERSAAFFGLGLAKQMKRPVAILCSSGTAAANYFPAIVEASLSRVPLIVLTADRPHELRDVGAPQAIDQIKLYGNYVKWFQEMALPEGTKEMLHYVRSKAVRAISTSLEGNQGPVHLNFPFREPLIPDFSFENIWGNQLEQSYSHMVDGQKKLAEDDLQQIAATIRSKERGLIVCGPQMNPALGEAVMSLAQHWEIPVLADPLSQVRSGDYHKENMIEGYDAFLRHEDIRTYLEADYIIRFGAMPVSKAYLYYIQQNSDALQFVVEEKAGYREPTNSRTTFVFSDPVQLCIDFIDATDKRNNDQLWLKKWQQMNHISKKILTNRSDTKLTEGSAVRTLLEIIPDESSLYVGNSMAVRDVDTFFFGTEKKVNVLANRGANGIDGMISSGMGAAASGKPATLLLGDLSFYHDMNGLLAAKHYPINLTILLVNNNGGGIFSFLPQVKEEKHFERLFGTPVGIEFEKVVELYGGQYHIAYDEETLTLGLENSYREKGLSVVEVKTDRQENVDWHRQLWSTIEQEILHSVIR